MALPAGPKPQLHTRLPEGLYGVAFIEAATGPLYRWQSPITADLTGDGRPRTAYVQVARKNGKSRLAAGIALEEIGCHDDAQVFLIADSERNLKSALFFEITSMIRRSPLLSNTMHVYKDHIECPETNSGIWLRPNNLSASQSINPSLVIFDEVHMQRDDRIWNGMALAGAATPDALLLGITTPGYDVNSMAHDLYVRGKAGSDPHLYSRIFEPQDPNCAFDDDTALRQANPILADRPELLAVFKGELPPTLPEHDYRRFRLGQWTTSASGWFPYGHWDTLSSPARLLDPTERVWLGFDGSYSGDSTALVAVTVDGFVSVLGCWENPGSKGWRVPRNQVIEAVVQAMATLNVQFLICDPPYWQSEIAEWNRRWPGKVVEFPTFSRARMAPACTQFHAAVMEKRISHDGDKRLARHIANCEVHSSPMGDYITKADPNSPAKIDLAVAMVVAYSMAGQASSKPRARKWVL